MLVETFKVFCDLVETKSFSRAAEKNFISQSAVSQQVRALETKFGRKLIERGHGAAEPTEAGKVFYARARTILDRFRRLEDEVMERARTIVGAVQVATIASVGLHELPPYLKKFTTAHPQVTIHLQYCRADRVYELILTDKVNVGVVAYPVRHPQIEIIPFRDDQLVFVCAPSHSLARQRSVTLEQIAGERLIGFESDIPTRKATDRIFRDAGLNPHYVMEFDEIETIKRMVEIDAGVSILPDFPLAQELKNKTLRALRFEGKRYYRPIALIYKRAGDHSAAVSKFIETLTDEQPTA